MDDACMLHFYMKVLAFLFTFNVMKRADINFILSELSL